MCTGKCDESVSCIAAGTGNNAAKTLWLYWNVFTSRHGNSSTLVYASNINKGPNSYLVISFGRNLLCSLKWLFKRGYSEVITLLSNADCSWTGICRQADKCVVKNLHITPYTSNCLFKNPQVSWNTVHVTRIKNIKNVTRYRDSRSAKSIETR